MTKHDQCTPDCLSQKSLHSRYLRLIFAVRFVAKAKVSEGTNRNMSARNTLVLLLALYTDPESHNVQRYRQTDDVMMPIADHTV